MHTHSNSNDAPTSSPAPRQGWVKTCLDQSHEHFAIFEKAKEAGEGRTLCEKFNLFGVYCMTASPSSLPACSECVEKLDAQEGGAE